MARFSPRRELSPASAAEKQSACVTSMERALRTLPYKSSVPLTPRRNGNDRYGAEKCVSSNSTFRRAEERSDNIISSEEAVRVAIRVRPLAPGGDQCAERAWKISPEQNAIVEIRGAQNESFTTPSRTRRGSGDSEYVYDTVFGEDANTCEIYDASVRDLVESVTEEGINATVFTYGQTCSGKTFTMQGCNSHKGSVGIIHLAAKDIFQTIKDDDSNSEYSVRVSYVEIYNEELRDLLSDNNRKSSTSLIIREDKTGSIAVDGLREVAVKNLDQLMEVFRFGEKNKSVGSTKMNDRSSRSHAILKIVFEKRTVVNPKLAAGDKENFADLNSPSNVLVVKTTSVLNLVDLAGSESVRHTGAPGMQKKEGGMINQSLLTLSKVLMSLGQKNPGHVNYRDSKLTRILKPSLCGNARMAVICCISSSGKYVEETRSTLQFATRAKLVKTNAVRHEEVEDADLIAKLRLEISRAKWENGKLEEQLRRMETLNYNSLMPERELANLKKIVFGEKPKAVSQSRVNQRLSLAPLSLVHDHRIVSMGKTSKDDSCIPSRSTEENELYTSSSSSGSFLRDALDFKAKQVKNLQARIDRLNGAQATKAIGDGMTTTVEGRATEEDWADVLRRLGNAENALARAEHVVWTLTEETLRSELDRARQCIVALRGSSSTTDGGGGKVSVGAEAESFAAPPEETVVSGIARIYHHPLEVAKTVGGPTGGGAPNRGKRMFLWPTARVALRNTSRNDCSSVESADAAEHSHPVKTVELFDEVCSESVSSPISSLSLSSPSCEWLEGYSEAFSTKNSSNVASVQTGIHQTSPAADRGISWPEMWAQMKENGWTHIAGSGLVLWYSMHPTCAGMKKKELLRDKKEGIDYFTSQEDLKQYAKLYLGWMGDGVSVGADSPNDAEMVERVKKRKRRATLKAAEQATAKSMLQMKKNASKSAKGAAKQQTCNRMTKGSAPKMVACSEVCSGSVSSVEFLFVKRADEKGSKPPRRREM